MQGEESDTESIASRGDISPGQRAYAPIRPSARCPAEPRPPTRQPDDQMPPDQGSRDEGRGREPGFGGFESPVCARNGQAELLHTCPDPGIVPLVSEKRQTRCKAGTQSHGAHEASRATERQETTMAVPTIEAPLSQGALLTPGEVAVLFRVDPKRSPAGPRPASSRRFVPSAATAASTSPRSARCSRAFPRSVASDLDPHLSRSGRRRSPPVTAGFLHLGVSRAWR